ncbi:hypothetical protein [Kitasatospora sp. A2-31]|uniref:hypothetical protein n=1 Tax=Kitasatospora sp. A2-31 TaxID=2916414 RepID=UPI001EE8642B|nr:hypothetical protein [Kitasatospora sp. A2-31]MCG6493782.1 hypothetical protein [Kitasatospora sp. A2-31]
MSTSRPDSAAAPAPEPDRTVRLGAAPKDVEATVRLGSGPAAEELTVRLTGAPEDAEQTVRLGSEAVAGEQTVRLAGGSEAVEATVRLESGPVTGEQTVRQARRTAGPAAAEPDTEATVRLDADDPGSATFLDPRVWGGAPQAGETSTLVDTRTGGRTVPAPPAADETDATGTVESAATAPTDSSPTGGRKEERSFAPGELRRFGPGVPPQAAAVWHGAAVPDREQPGRRRASRWLVPLAVLLAVLALLAFLFWRFTSPALAVTGVGVTTDPAGPGCGGTAVITATVETDGGAGTIRYRWLRSDGTTSDEIRQDVESGARKADLVLRWSFEGRGELQATATLQILSPDARTAAVSFPYRCS